MSRLEHEMFGEGRAGIIQLRAGGQLETKPEDEVLWNEKGDLLIRHNDPAETITFVSGHNLATIRTYNTESTILRRRLNSASEASTSKRSDNDRVVPDDPSHHRSNRALGPGQD